MQRFIRRRFVVFVDCKLAGNRTKESFRYSLKNKKNARQIKACLKREFKSNSVPFHVCSAVLR